MRLFITGGAGVGKSHLINTLRQFLEKTFTDYTGNAEKPKVLVLAPTGVAAINVDGTTIHSGLGIPVNCKTSALPKLSDAKRCQLRNLFSEVEIIIIDEISMVSNITLTHIHQRLCEIFGCNLDQPFAGKTVLVVGDLMQLPPVRAQYVFVPPPGPFGNIFSLWSTFKMCELTQVMRQRGDNVFIDLLNNIRVGKLTESQFEILENCYSSIEAVDQNSTLLYAENSVKYKYNYHRLEKLNFPQIEMEAIDDYPENISWDLKSTFKQLGSDKTGGLAQTLELKKEARVMVTTNIDISDRLINGQLGSVFDFEYSGANITRIYLKLDDPTAGLKAQSTNRFAIQHNVVPIERTVADIPLSRFSGLYVKRTQFPLILAWACTIHKVQGLTLQKVGLSLDLQKQKKFSPGQLYVALSRATSISSLSLLGKLIVDKHVNVNQACLDEYTRLRTSANCLSSIVTNENVFLALLNIRGLISNIKNFLSDTNFYTAPLICITETHLIYNSNTDSVNSDLQQYELIMSNSDCKYESVAVLYKPEFFVCQQTLSLNGMLLVKFKSLSSHLFSFNMLLVYRRNDRNIEQFIQTICYLIVDQDIHIVLGDFNINDAHDNLARIKLLERGFHQLIHEPTHVRGSILDHIYIRQSWEFSQSFSSIVCSNYYSDHQSVFLKSDFK